MAESSIHLENNKKSDINNVHYNKIRKSRNDFIRSTLGNYLKHRNYTASDKFKKSDFKLLQSKPEFIFNKMLEQDLSKGNSFLYSNVLCLTTHHNVVDQQFVKFVQFVNSQSGDLKNELSSLFGPMICHIYIDLLNGKEWKPAYDFLRNHAHLIAPVENLDAPLSSKINASSVEDSDEPVPSTSNEKNNDGTNSSSACTSSNTTVSTATTQILFSAESTGNAMNDYFKDLISTLSTCSKFEEICSHEKIVLLRSSKYEIQMSFDTVQVLRDFLEKQGHLVIMKILHTWIHISITDFVNSDNEEDTHNILTLFKEIKSAKSTSSHSNNSMPLDNNKISSTKKTEIESIKPNINRSKQIKVNYNLLTLKVIERKFDFLEKPTKTIKILDPDKSLISTSIDANECHMAGVFNDSTIKLWSLKHHRSTQYYERINDRLCEWGLSNIESLEDEDDDTSDIERSRRKIRLKQKERYYSRKCEENSFDDYGGIILRGHTRGVTDCMFSKRFPLLYTTSKDCTLRVWKADDYNCGAIYKGHNYPIWCVTESPIGTYLATGSRDYTARLWTVEQEFPLMTYVGHSLDVESVAFHPNGAYLATGSADYSVRLWSVTNGRLLRVFADRKFSITCIAFSPNGSYLAVGGEENKVRIYDLAAASLFNELRDQQNSSGSVTDITWNSKSSKIASCSDDGSVRIWNVEKSSPSNATEQRTSPSLKTTKSFHYHSILNRGIKIFFNEEEEVVLVGTVQSINNCNTNSNTSCNLPSSKTTN